MWGLVVLVGAVFVITVIRRVDDEGLEALRLLSRKPGQAILIVEFIGWRLHKNLVRLMSSVRFEQVAPFCFVPCP